jgi:PAS domain S-box-containing protein
MKSGGMTTTEPLLDGNSAEHRFRCLLEAAPDAIVIVNGHGIIELINSQTEQVFGYSRADLLGKTMEILIPERFREHHVDHRIEYAEAPFTRRIGMGRTLSARRKDGSEFPAEIGISPLQTEAGMLVISSIRDVTDRVAAEKVISKLNSELEARVNRRTAALRKANEKLHKEIAARHRLEKEILEISEREQQRIGRNLHDDLGQRLAGISYMSQVLANSLAAASSPDAGHAAKITDLLNNAIALTRSLARGLHPVALKSGGLMASLGDLAQRTSEFFQMTCRFAGPFNEPNLNQSAATHLYRIAREAVANAVNHGKANVIRIELSDRPGYTILSVTDNGTGMPKLNPRRKGMGLSIMNYRADMIGASLEFSTPQDGHGTTVSCAIPRTGNTA